MPWFFITGAVLRGSGGVAASPAVIAMPFILLFTLAIDGLLIPLFVLWELMPSQHIRRRRRVAEPKP